MTRKPKPKTPHGAPLSVHATFWHECLHAICNVYGQHRSTMTESYRLGNVQRQMTIEEMYVGFLEAGVLLFVRDNPHAWAWILNQEAG